jgi:ricin-type beta-trefoil lectin protein
MMCGADQPKEASMSIRSIWNSNSMTKSIACLSIPAVIVALNLPTPALAAPPSGRVAIMNAHSNLCLSPAGGNRNLNDETVQFNCDSDPSRFWSFTVVGGDQVEITNLNSGLCLTVAGGNTVRNDPSVQFTCDSDPSRRWRFRDLDADTFQLVNVNSNLCLTIAGGSTDLNVTAVQFPCDGDTSRNWRIRR